MGKCLVQDMIGSTKQCALRCNTPGRETKIDGRAPTSRTPKKKLRHGLSVQSSPRYARHTPMAWKCRQSKQTCMPVFSFRLSRVRDAKEMIVDEGGISLSELM